MKESISNRNKGDKDREQVRIRTEIAERMAFNGESKEVATEKVTGKKPLAKPRTKVAQPKASTKKRARRVAPPTVSKSPTPGLVNANGLLKNIWPDKASRPTAKWLYERAKAGDVPCVRIGGSYFFEVKKVRAALMGEQPHALSEEKAAKMSNAELWTMLEKIESAEERRAFYVKHLKQRPGLA